MLTNSSLLKEHGYVNGQWVGDDAQSRFDVKNTYTNEVISTLPEMGKKEPMKPSLQQTMLGQNGGLEQLKRERLS
jgi:acyl-CoA reductase-like NAD-dependent aldehyde dehydrogenase